MKNSIATFGLDSVKGVVPPIATPIVSDEIVDEKGMRRLVNYLLNNGVHCIFVMGGTGEFFTFPDREKQRAIEIVVDEVNKKVPVIAGVTDLSTRRTIDNSHVAQQAGANFLTSLPPFFFSMDQNWIENFYMVLAGETDLPILLYNILNPVHTNIKPETVRRLSEHPKIVGIKDSEDYAHLQEIVFMTKGSEFKVLDGLESHFYAALNVGAAGGVLSASNFCPMLCCDIYNKTMAGDNEGALRLQSRLNSLLSELQGFSSWWGVVKTCLSILGICNNAVTHPVPPCTSEERKRLTKIMKRYDLL